MVGSIIKDGFHADYRISGQRSLHHRSLESLFHCREVVLRHCAADYDLFEYIWSLQVSGGFEFHLDMTILSMSAGLLLILGIHVGIFADCLTEGHLRGLQDNLCFVSGQKLADRDLQMLVAHTVKQRLTVLAVNDSLQCYILRHHTRQRLGYLVFFSFILDTVSHICIRYGILGLGIQHLCILSRKSIACLRICQLRDSADISRKQLADLRRLVAAHDIQLARFLLCLAGCVEKNVIAFEYTRTYLYEGIFSDKRIHHCLEYISSLRLGEIVIAFKDIVGRPVDSRTASLVRAWEETHDIGQQVRRTLRFNIGPHCHRYDISAHYFSTHSRADLFYRKFLTAEITVHKLFACLRHRFHQGIPQGL